MAGNFAAVIGHVIMVTKILIAGNIRFGNVPVLSISSFVLLIMVDVAKD